MSETTTIARPYAKAIFEHALEANNLAQWSITLQNMKNVVLNKSSREFIKNPAVTEEQEREFLTSFIPKNMQEHQDTQNFIRLLIHNKRLLLLPEIYEQYEMLRFEQEKKLTAEVSSFAPLSKEQQQQLVDALSQRFQYQVTLKVNIKPELLGGAVIKVGDLVIDGSVRGQLNKLAQGLAA